MGKKYLGQEWPVGTSKTQEEWAVIRVTMLEDGDVERQQVSVFLTEDEAEEEAENLQDQDGDDNVIYKVELIC